MRWSVYVGVCFIIPAFSFAQTPRETVSSSIEEVIVFTQGAQITRTASIRLTSGTTDVVFTGLTPYLLPNQIQAAAHGNVTVLSVTHRENYLEPPEASLAIQQLRTQMVVVRDSIALEGAFVEVYQQEEAMLLENRAIGGADTGVPVEALKEAAAYFRQRLTEIKTEQLQIRHRIRALNQRLEALNRQLNELQGNQRREPTSEVTVTVQASAPTNATLTLEYITPQAGWYPHYDLRVQDVDHPVALSYKANVYQRTGVLWENVDLTLSTGNPSQSGTRPELFPWQVDIGSPVRQRQRSRAIPGPRETTPSRLSGRIFDAETGNPLPGASIQIMGTNLGTTTDMDGFYELAPQARSSKVRVSFIGYQSITVPLNSSRIDFQLAHDRQALQEVVAEYERPLQRSDFRASSGVQVRGATALPSVETNVNTTTVEFEIELPYTILPDGQSQNVHVQQHEIPASYVYYAAPKLDQDAFLTAKITGWEDYHLLNGEANLFLDGAFVGTSQLDMANVQDTLVVSLGRDKGVVVERTQRRDFTKRTFFRDKQVESFAYDIEVRNTKGVPIEIIVEDHVPLTTDDALDIRVKPDDEAVYDKDTGILTWRLVLPPGTSERVSFEYELRYPVGEHLVGH